MVKCDWCKSPEHGNLLEELCEHDPETQRLNRLIAEFYKVYPQIYGLSFTGANVLRLEKNLKIQKAAINAVAEEIVNRPKVGDGAYSITRRRVTADQVRGILKEQRILIEGTDIQRVNLVKRKEEKDKDMLYTCPLCKGLITVTLSKRDKIVSLRTTAEADDAYAYLAKQFDVSRSFLLSELIAIQSKFPSLFM
jgi:hypothetical protein